MSRPEWEVIGIVVVVVVVMVGNVDTAILKENRYACKD
jgi:hypothetical protein